MEFALQCDAPEEGILAWNASNLSSLFPVNGIQFASEARKARSSSPPRPHAPSGDVERAGAEAGLDPASITDEELAELARLLEDDGTRFEWDAPLAPSTL